MLAKGNICLRLEELKKLIGLDENAEITGVNLDSHGIEIQIISSEPIDGITHYSDGQLMRRRYVALPVVTMDDESVSKVASEVVNHIKKVEHLRARGENNDA